MQLRSRAAAGSARRTASARRRARRACRRTARRARSPMRALAGATAARRRRGPRARAPAAGTGRLRSRVAAPRRGGVFRAPSRSPGSRRGRSRASARSADRRCRSSHASPSSPTALGELRQLVEPGCGVSALGSSSLRSNPSRRRISASASRPVCSTFRIDSRARSGSACSSRRAPAGLHDHHADAVGDDVLQLAADRQALLRDGRAFALGPLRRCLGARAPRTRPLRRVRARTPGGRAPTARGTAASALRSSRDRRRSRP